MMVFNNLSIQAGLSQRSFAPNPLGIAGELPLSTYFVAYHKPDAASPCLSIGFERTVGESPLSLDPRCPALRNQPRLPTVAGLLRWVAALRLDRQSSGGYTTGGLIGGAGGA